jgi:hypothetical protein
MDYNEYMYQTCYCLFTIAVSFLWCRIYCQKPDNKKGVCGCDAKSTAESKAAKGVEGAVAGTGTGGGGAVAGTGTGGGGAVAGTGTGGGGAVAGTGTGGGGAVAGTGTGGGGAVTGTGTRLHCLFGLRPIRKDGRSA